MKNVLLNGIKKKCLFIRVTHSIYESIILPVANKILRYYCDGQVFSLFSSDILSLGGFVNRSIELAAKKSNSSSRLKRVCDFRAVFLINYYFFFFFNKTRAPLTYIRKFLTIFNSIAINAVVD